MLVGIAFLITGCSAAPLWSHSYHKGLPHAPFPQPSHLSSQQHCVAAIPSAQTAATPLLSLLSTYCQALISDTIPAAFDLLDPDAQRVVTEGEFAAQVDRVQLDHHGLRLCQVVDPPVLFPTAAATDANAVITILYGDGSQEKLGMGLMEENHHWKILLVGVLCLLPPGAADWQADHCCTLPAGATIFPASCSG